MSFNLKQTLKASLLDGMIRKVRSTLGTDEYVVLVVDTHTSKILSSCARMYDVMDSGVLVLENLNLGREKLDLHAVYFIENSRQSIEKVVNDFSVAKKPQYKAVHLFFTGRVSNKDMNLIKDAKELVKRIKTFQEINVDFIASETSVFHFGRSENVLRNLYFPPSPEDMSHELTVTSAQLCSLLLTLGEYPIIRYADKGGAICKTFAKYVETDMKNHIGAMREWKNNESRPRGTLLIVDRSIDPAAPLMHEYTFQAMVNDLLKVDGELCTLGKKGESIDGENTVVLSEDDALWISYRHQHIGQVMSDISAKFKEFKKDNSMAKLQGGGGDSSIKDMLNAMKAMPAYKTMMKKYTKHMGLAQECMRKFDAKQLKDLGELEQDMATGLTGDGSSVDTKRMKEALVKMSQSSDIGVLEKVRLLMIYIISQGGVQEQTRKELMRTIDESLQDAIRNLSKLGVEVAAGYQKNKNKAKHSKARMAEFAKRASTIPLALMRYVPHLNAVISGLVNNELTEEEFPFTAPPPPEYGQKTSRRATAAPTRWRGESRAKGAGAPAPEKEKEEPLFIVFVLGGVSFSEIRSVYELQESTKTNILIGSTNTLTPKQCLQQLAGLNKRAFNKALKASKGNADPGSDISEDDKGAKDDSDDEGESKVPVPKKGGKRTSI